MMHKFHMVTLTLLLATVCSFAESNSLPVLSSDGNITSGTLVNGMKYYFAFNKSSNGMTAFSLVQKIPASWSDKVTLERYRDYFSKVSYPSGTLEKVLSRNTAMTGTEGFIRMMEGAVIYDLGELSSARGEAAVDTLVLSLFSLARLSAAEGQPSSSQAIVIAGDFDKAQMLAKLKMLSITNPNVPGSVSRDAYQWSPPEGNPMAFDIQEGPVSRITVRWRGARTPREYMNTVLPVISDKMSGELGWVLTNRLYPAFRSKGLFVSLDYNFQSSAKGLSDEVITLSAGCMRKYLSQVCDVMREELSRLYTWGVDEIEYTYARDAYKYRWIDSASAVRESNESYVDRCTFSFLYDAFLSSEQEKIKFAYRELPDSAQTRFFNNYMRRMFSQNCLVDSTLTHLPSMVGREIVSAALDNYAPAVVNDGPREKSRKKNHTGTEDKEEYVTGGVMWTFPNGVNVIYKRTGTNGQVHYSYASRGGRKWADPDYFSTIDGVFEQAFSNYLSSAGIQLKLSLGATDVRLEGKVPQENVEKMLNVVSALSNQKENRNVFSGECYKLFTIVGDLPQEQVKSLMTRYVTVLGPGARWAAPSEPVITEETFYDEDDLRIDAGCDIIFPLEVTAANYALSDVAFYALNDALREAFADKACVVNINQGFVGAPSWDYRMVLSICRAPLDGFSTDDEHMDADSMQKHLRLTLKELAARKISPARLSVYKTMAKNAFASFATTPEYYLEAVRDRYLDNKDFKSKYKSWVDAVSAESLQQFYAAAASANK